MIKHIFFDLDHTLWDFEKNSSKTFEFILRKNNIDINLNEFLKEYKPINQYYWKLYREEKIAKPDLRYARLKDTFRNINYAINDDIINLLADEYIDCLSNYNELFEGTFEILDYLKQKYSLHIITNGFNEVQMLKLKNSAINTYFDKVITSESAGVKKPNPKIFYHALSITNAEASESLMIGDNLEADVFGAINAGLKAIHFNFENSVSDSSFTTISKLEELKLYL